MSVDYTLYLVTDSTLLPPSRTLVDQVSAAIRGGVTIVQLREKHISTRDFIALGKQVHAVTRAHNVPLLINDRVDVALAVGCEGVHVGWDDCDVATARRLLGKDKIIGLSVSDFMQAREAAQTDCDYIGLGPFFATSTKPDANPPLGIEGAQNILRALPELFNRQIPVVSIGGIKESNIGEIQAACAPLGLSGHAIVSAIISAPDATATCNALLAAISTTPKPLPPLPEPTSALVERVFKSVQKTRPLIHHITNSVVKNFSANVCLSLGGSPIMSECSEEASDLAKMNGALLINMGTLSSDIRELYNAAFTANYNENVPCIFDPVGAGATDFRRKWAKIVMDNWKVDILKGNEGEIRAVAGEEVVMKGVDYDAREEGTDKFSLTRKLAQKYNCVVVMTGVKDVISDGETVWELDDGSEFQGLVTGTGCALGTCLAVAAAGMGKVDRGDEGLTVEGRRKLGQAAIAGLALYNAAARCAGDWQGGPASWQTGFVDKLWSLASACNEEGQKRTGCEGQGRTEFEKALRKSDGSEVRARVALGPETA